METPNIGPYCCILLARSTTFAEDNDIGVLGRMSAGGDFALIEFGDKIDEAGDEAEEWLDDVEGDGEGRRGILLVDAVSKSTFPRLNCSNIESFLL